MFRYRYIIQSYVTGDNTQAGPVSAVRLTWHCMISAYNCDRSPDRLSGAAALIFRSAAVRRGLMDARGPAVINQLLGTKLKSLSQQREASANRVPG